MNNETRRNGNATERAWKLRFILAKWPSGQGGAVDVETELDGEAEVAREEAKSVGS